MKFEIKNRYTRKIDKEYNKRLLEKSETIRNEDGVSFKVDGNSVAEANDWLICQLCGVTLDEVEGLDKRDRDEVWDEVEKIKSPL